MCKGSFVGGGVVLVEGFLCKWLFKFFAKGFSGCLVGCCEWGCLRGGCCRKGCCREGCFRGGCCKKGCCRKRCCRGGWFGLGVSECVC